jgi:hypothetical protein
MVVERKRKNAKAQRPQRLTGVIVLDTGTPPNRSNPAVFVICF